jgi:hypothetical protein
MKMMGKVVLPYFGQVFHKVLCQIFPHFLGVGKVGESLMTIKNIFL